MSLLLGDQYEMREKEQAKLERHTTNVNNAHFGIAENGQRWHKAKMVEAGGEDDIEAPRIVDLDVISYMKVGTLHPRGSVTRSPRRVVARHPR
jgi:hypothetical protein